MPCQGISPLMKITAGFSAAILATNARRTTGLVAVVSVACVNRMSPYAISTSGPDGFGSGTLNVVAACEGPVRMANKSDTMGTTTRITRCYAQETLAAMRLLVLAILCALCGFGIAHAADGDARRQQRAMNVLIVRDNWGIAHIYGKSDADA